MKIFFTKDQRGKKKSIRYISYLSKDEKEGVRYERVPVSTFGIVRPTFFSVG